MATLAAALVFRECLLHRVTVVIYVGSAISACVELLKLPLLLQASLARCIG